MAKLRTVLSISATSLLLACASTHQDVGTITGGAIGALLGAQVGQGSGRTVAVMTGTVAGAFIGQRIGQYMDQQDRLFWIQTMENQADGQRRVWQNPNTHRRYQVTPVRTFYRTYRGHKQPCRRYHTKVFIGGNAETVTGTACRLPNGTWRIAS